MESLANQAASVNSSSRPVLQSMNQFVFVVSCVDSELAVSLPQAGSLYHGAALADYEPVR